MTKELKPKFKAGTHLYKRTHTKHTYCTVVVQVVYENKIQGKTEEEKMWSSDVQRGQGRESFG